MIPVEHIPHRLVELRRARKAFERELERIQDEIASLQRQLAREDIFGIEKAAVKER